MGKSSASLENEDISLPAPHYLYLYLSLLESSAGQEVLDHRSFRGSTMPSRTS